MFEIGDSLRDARKRQGLDVSDVERRTKIRARYLLALEEERFDLIPGQAYAKGFLRSYSEALGLDSKPFLDEFDERFADEDEDFMVSLEEVDAGGWAFGSLARRAALATVAVLFGAVVLAASLHEDGSRSATPADSGLRERVASSGASSGRQTAERVRPKPEAVGKRRTLEPVPLEAVSPWDPDGDGDEHGDEAPLATDGDPATYWRTETYYAGLRKQGVGLVVATASPTRLARITLGTSTPGYRARIEAGASPSGPFTPVSASREVTGTTSFALRGRPAQYYLVWITGLDRTAHVNELRAFRSA